jgi:hypothetical protein
MYEIHVTVDVPIQPNTLPSFEVIKKEFHFISPRNSSGRVEVMTSFMTSDYKGALEAIDQRCVALAIPIVKRKVETNIKHFLRSDLPYAYTEYHWRMRDGDAIFLDFPYGWSDRHDKPHYPMLYTTRCDRFTSPENFQMEVLGHLEGISVHEGAHFEVAIIDEHPDSDADWLPIFKNRLKSYSVGSFT